MASEPQRLTDFERSNLVAYLDGELAEGDADSLRVKITQSVTARREIESLEKTWDLLDYLPRPEAPPELANRTLTEIRRVELRGGRLEDAASRAGSLVARLLACAAAVLVALGVGYAAVRWAWPDRTAQLARDLPIAEHLDEYRGVGSFQFLKMLDTSPAFNEDTQ